MFLKKLKKIDQFPWLAKCEVTYAPVLVIVGHLKTLVFDLKERSSDLEQVDFPTLVMQSVLVDLSDVSMQYQEDLSEMQCEESFKTVQYNRSDGITML